MFTIPIWIVAYEKYVSIAQLSVLVTVGYIAQIVFEVPSGALADLIGRKNTNLIGFLIGAVAYFAFPFLHNFEGLLIFSILVGLSDSCRSGSEEALVYDSYKQAKKENEFPQAYGRGNILYQCGLIFATALGGLLYTFNNDLPYTLYGVSLLIGSLLVLFYVEPSIDSEKFSIKNYFHQMIDGSKEVFKNQYVKWLSLFYIFVGGIGWSSTIYFNDFMMISLGFNSSLRGHLTAGMRLINVAFIGSLLKNEKLFTFKRTVLFFPVVMLIGYLPGIFLSSFWGLPFIQLAMVATTARWIILSPLTNAAFESKYRATAISFMSLAIGLVFVTMTSISALIIPQFGINVMYSLLGLVSLLTVLPIGLKLLHTHKTLHKNGGTIREDGEIIYTPTH